MYTDGKLTCIAFRECSTGAKISETSKTHRKEASDSSAAHEGYDAKISIKTSEHISRNDQH